jgi:hypothetical protein
MHRRNVTKDCRFSGNNFVNTGNVQVHPTRLVTCGLNTCIFVCIQTEKGLIGWHASSDNMKGFNMKRITTILNTVTSKNFNRGFIVPGVDRTKDLLLKRDCRTLKVFPETNVAASRDFLFNVLSTYSWGSKLRCLPGLVKNYKHLVYVDADESFPYVFADESFHDNACIVDGGA